MTKKESKEDKLINSILHLMKSKKSGKKFSPPDPLDNAPLSEKPTKKRRPS